MHDSVEKQRCGGFIAAAQLVAGDAAGARKTEKEFYIAATPEHYLTGLVIG